MRTERALGRVTTRPLVGVVALGLLASGLARCSFPPAHAPAPSPPSPAPALLVTSAPPTDLQLSAALAAITTVGPPPSWKEQRQGLFRGYLATLSARGPVTRPELFPSPEYVLAYLVNAHIAWTIALGSAREYSSLDMGALRELPVTVDGRTTSLRGLADEIARRAPFEPRLALFLNPGWRGAPPLPVTALEGHSFAWQLADHAQLCGHSPGFWDLDRDRKVVKVTSFTNFMWALPGVQPARLRRVFDLVPPPDKVRSEIASVCGPSLSGCSVEYLPLDRARLWDASGRPARTVSMGP